MSLKHLCRKDVVTVKPETLVEEVTKIMEEKNIGSVLVSDAGTDWKDLGIKGAKDFGIVTDRDIALRVINNRLDPTKVPIEKIMTKKSLLVLDEDMGLYEALEQITKAAVRRFPVVDSEGNLQGIITIDDIIQLLGKEMADVAKVIENESPVL